MMFSIIVRIEQRKEIRILLLLNVQFLHRSLYVQENFKICQHTTEAISNMNGMNGKT